jgi:hypothetical protein
MIVEQGGYPNFTALYQSFGYQVLVERAMRKAMGIVRREKPATIVAEFNYQSDFRDRTSSLESLLATVQKLQQSDSIKIRVVVFYEKQYFHQLEKLRQMFGIIEALSYPIDEESLVALIS